MKAHIIIVSTVIICFILSCKKDEPSEIILNEPPIPNFEIDNTCEPVGDGIAYEVGPGKDYENVTDVPFEGLNPGDVVKIYARSTPYNERILVTSAKGTADAPICICGVADDNGNLPILDGTNARVRYLEGMNDYFYDVTAYLGMIVICNRYENHPEYIHIKNLQIQGAHQYLRDESQKCYVMGSDELRPYGDGAAGIWMRGKHIEVSNCIIQHNGNGIFGAFNSDADPLVDVKLYGNIIRNNGTKDQFLQHNIYIEADGLESIGNQFGPMRDGSPGANYKSRGAGDVIMYNKFVGPAARHFDLVESQNGYGNLSEKESFRYSYVVGNIVEAVSGGAGNILHYGGDGDNTTPSYDLRQGTVYAYNNTFILKGYYLSGDSKGQWR
ncbi:MAG: hypothetical protein MI922_14655, partial [Bacteroidales bacterium]|nr:hypothetical protein [Bacteroidales bacterium]